MKQSKLAKILNTLSLILVSFALIFLLINAIIKNSLVSLIISLFAVSIIANELHHFRVKKTNRANLTLFEKQNENDLKNFLLTESEKTVTSVFENAIKSCLSRKKTGENKPELLNKNNETFDLKIKNNNIILAKTKTLIVPFFTSNELNEGNLISIQKLSKTYNLENTIIFCAKKAFTSSQFLLPKTLILEQYETYLFLKNQDALPSVIKEKANQKPHFSVKNLQVFNKASAKPLFLSAMFLYFLSFLVKFKIYYIIFASICLTLSLNTLIFAKPEQSVSTYDQALPFIS